MSEPQSDALTLASEARRRELPAAVAITILVGGLAAAILGDAGAVGWAALVAGLLIIDAEIYKRLDAKNVRLEGRRAWQLAAWSFAASMCYVALPVALWLDGQAAGAAAALVLWIVGVVRHVGPVSPNFTIAAAGAAPPSFSLVIAPLAAALFSASPDWDLAVIVTVGGGALIAYAIQARLSGLGAESRLRREAEEGRLQQALAKVLFDQAAFSAFSAFLVDRDMRIVAMSNRIREGWGLGDVEGMHMDDACPWRPPGWDTVHARVLSGEHLHGDQYEIVTPNGKKWVEWNARPWRGQNDEILGAVVFGRDVTVATRARRAAQESEERFRVALAAGAGFVWEIDLKYGTLTWHGDPAPLYGRAYTLAEFSAATLPCLEDEDRVTIQAQFDAAAAGKIDRFEHRLRLPNGDAGWAEVWVRAVPGRSGATRKIIGISRDISQRKREEAAFLSAMGRAENAVRAKRAMLSDARDRSVLLAAAPVEDVSHDVSLGAMFARLDSLLAEMDARDALLAETLESLRRAREHAEGASVSKSQFLASMSHELRTPLNAIIGYSEILLEEAEDAGRESDQKDLERVLSAARQLLHLINDILDLSKIEAGRMDVAATDFEVIALIDDAVDTVRPMVEKNGNTLRVEVDGDLGASHSDAFKITQCLLNLLSNAAKFTKDGEILIRAARTTGDDGAPAIEVAVKDQGIGLSAEQLARLFQPFTQAEATTQQKFGGTGLGLVITRRMMELVGGDVRAESVLGEGATFTLRWPAIIEGVRDDEAPEKPVTLAAAPGSTALVIDDEESARDLVVRALTRLGLNVHQASTADSGFALARAVKPSVIILDINLPDLSGWELMRELRNDPICEAIPVVIHSVDDDRKRAMTLGACEHLVKPADRDMLAAVVARMVRPEASAPAQAQSNNVVKRA